MDAIQGRVSIVTGAGRGIGRAVSTELARRGAKVALVARGEGEIRAVAREIESNGGQALAVPADVTSEAQVGQMVDRVLAEYGTVDVLVNNAGTTRRGPVETLPLRHWNEVLAVNLTGVFLCSRAVIPTMKRQCRGHIINISSGAGKQGYPDLSAYCVSKFGVIGFSESLAAELMEWKIKVASLLPGSVDTTFGGRAWGSGRPGSRWLQPEDVAQAIVCLLSQSGRAWTQEMNLWPFA